MDQPRHRKRIKHYHSLGDLHELTFSCYRRMKLLTNDGWLSRSIDEACAVCTMDLVAFVFMPEHVHLLVLPRTNEPDLPTFLALVKRPVSVCAKESLVASNSHLLKRLTIRERPGRRVFRFWQEGPGFDRNLASAAEVQTVMEYFHLNPVKRKLCRRAVDWRWSSARFYDQGEAHPVDDVLPKITPLPAEFWQG